MTPTEQLLSLAQLMSGITLSMGSLREYRKQLTLNTGYPLFRVAEGTTATGVNKLAVLDMLTELKLTSVIEYSNPALDNEVIEYHCAVLTLIEHLYSVPSLRLAEVIKAALDEYAIHRSVRSIGVIQGSFDKAGEYLYQWRPVGDNPKARHHVHLDVYLSNTLMFDAMVPEEPSLLNPDLHAFDSTKFDQRYLDGVGVVHVVGMDDEIAVYIVGGDAKWPLYEVSQIDLTYCSTEWMNQHSIRHIPEHIRSLIDKVPPVDADDCTDGEMNGLIKAMWNCGAISVDPVNMTSEMKRYLYGLLLKSI